MTIGEARALARRWVDENGVGASGFMGAFTHGSSNWLPEGAMISPTSDLDVVVVLDAPGPEVRIGKLLYGGVVLDVSCLASDAFRSAEAILGQSHLACSFAHATVLADDAGRLARLQDEVRRSYTKRNWVRKRCEGVRSRLLGHLDGLNETVPLHSQVFSWVFGAGLTTHVLLVAGLRNPTVRRRYVAVRGLLADYGLAGFYPELLELMGAAGLPCACMERHLAALSEAYDAAASVMATPVPFAGDIGEHARPIELGVCRELVEQGLHREAAFWVTVTYSRCEQVLFNDAPPYVRDRHGRGYRQLLADLGIASPADLRRRCDEIKAFLPHVWEVAEAIVAANPSISE